MATTTLTDRFRLYTLNGDLDFEADTYNFALYNNSSHDASTAVYTVTNEAPTSGNYVAKGEVMTGVSVVLDGTNHVAHVDWDDVSWATSTITATDGMIFADSVTTPAADPAVYIGDFGGSRSSNSGTFLITLPTAGYNTSVIRIA